MKEKESAATLNLFNSNTSTIKKIVDKYVCCRVDV